MKLTASVVAAIVIVVVALRKLQNITAGLALPVAFLLALAVITWIVSRMARDYAPMAPAGRDPMVTWAAWVAEAGRHGPKAADVIAGQCRVIATAPDPGHPEGLSCALLDPPKPWTGYFRVLHAANGTPGPSGLYDYVLVLVHPRHTDPVSAAAASYGVSVPEYRQLQRRT